MSDSRFAARHVPHLLLVVCGAFVACDAQAQMSPAQRADLVLRLLPVEARADATVLMREGDRTEAYREGTGRFLCVSDVTTPTRVSMVCHHRVLEERLALERRISRETELSGSGFRERLCSEVAERDMKVPDGAMEISASLSRNEDGTYASEMTVYHLLWLPYQTEATTGVTDEDPGEGRPWLHQAGTCGAHVMWEEEVEVRGEK